MLFLFIIVLANQLTNLNSLEAPKGMKVSFLEPLGFYVEWELVPRTIEDRISGYKVKLWKINEEISRNFKLLFGEQVPGLEKKDVSQEQFENHYTPKNEPTVFDVTNGYLKAIKIKDIKEETLYEVRVAAVRGSEIGPMSDPLRVKVIFRNTTTVMLAKRSLNYCELSTLNGLGDRSVNKDDATLYHTRL
ncbi:unnamed protein product [Leptidea sinapis]|uniref:Fibronectin type-III domain-containing protein n=1 Tax=Leptidea sinapis TaxID=189913 RepID=A0A5E4Q5W8_9NEOP|nr:unnamed protein product [Leptidea sinapis]